MNYQRLNVMDVVKNVMTTTFNVMKNVTSQQIRGLRAKLQMLWTRKVKPKLNVSDNMTDVSARLS